MFNSMYVTYCCGIVFETFDATRANNFTKFDIRIFPLQELMAVLVWCDRIKNLIFD